MRFRTATTTPRVQLFCFLISLVLKIYAFLPSATVHQEPLHRCSYFESPVAPSWRPRRSFVTDLASRRRSRFDEYQQQQQPEYTGNADPFGDFDSDYGEYDLPDTEASFPEKEFLNEDFEDFSDDNNDQEHSPSQSTTRLEEGTAVSEETRSHFFSRKALEDAAFRLRNDDDRDSKLFEKLCQGVGITRPSRIQSLAWPVLLSGKHAVVADQTGSGKTLAYLMPLLQRALVAKNKDAMSNKVVLNGAPRILVLAPTAELADQTKAVCNRLSQHVPFTSMVVTATGSSKYSTSIRDQIRMLQRQPIDVLISTPGRLATILRTRASGLNLLSNFQAIVLDEVDVLMLDETFGPQLRTVGAALAPAEQGQFVFCTATLPDSVMETVQKEFGYEVVKVLGPGLHRVAPTVRERLVDVSLPSKLNRNVKLGFEIKAKELLNALRQTRCRRTLIFCNTVDACRQVENLLKRKDRKSHIYQVLSYHNAMTPEARNQNLAIFAHGEEGGRGWKSNRRRSDRTGGRNGRTRDAVDYVLVCTDRAARGVDFDAAPVDHVVLFDFPKDPADYVRRVGRTARAGRSGASTVFAYGWQLPIARKVMGDGSRRDGFVTEATIDNDSDADDAYRGGVHGRRKKSIQRDMDAAIKGRIQDGKLWKE